MQILYFLLNLFFMRLDFSICFLLAFFNLSQCVNILFLR